MSKRFDVVYEQGVINRVKILRDNETGVNYMWATEGSGGGLTPLLDGEGKVVVTEEERQW